MADRLKLRDVRSMFRLVGEVRELGADPQQWRPHLITRLAKMLGAEVVVSSEIHCRTTRTPGVIRIVDIGWGCDADGNLWQIHTERDDANADALWLSVLPKPGRAGEDRTSEDRTGEDRTGEDRTGGDKLEDGETQASDGADPGEILPVKPMRPIYGGRNFILSQIPLPHIGAVDQLGLHHAWGDKPFGPAEHKLVRLFHKELGRLWKQDALRKAKDPNADLPPRLQQTLEALSNGASEKEVSIQLGISRHTVHNYVKALHQRLGVCSRGELLAKIRKRPDNFTPKFSSVDAPKR